MDITVNSPSNEELLRALRDIQRELMELRASVSKEAKIEKQVYEINDVATMLDCNPRKIYDLISEKKLRCVRLGKAIRIPKIFYEEFIRGEEVN